MTDITIILYKTHKDQPWDVRIDGYPTEKSEVQVPVSDLHEFFHVKKQEGYTFGVPAVFVDSVGGIDKFNEIYYSE